MHNGSGTTGRCRRTEERKDHRVAVENLAKGNKSAVAVVEKLAVENLADGGCRGRNVGYGVGRGNLPHILRENRLRSRRHHETCRSTRGQFWLRSRQLGGGFNRGIRHRGAGKEMGEKDADGQGPQRRQLSGTTAGRAAYGVGRRGLTSQLLARFS